MKVWALVITALLTMESTSFAVKFSNQFAEFELPPKWQCNLEGAEWVCQSSEDGKKRDALVVLAAKLKGDLDSLDRYQQYLNGPRTFTAPNGQAVKSNPKYTKITQINQQNWVDSLHLESEVPGFYTRYLATAKNDIAVLVTYSINKGKYQDYQSQFEDMVKSLKVFRKAGSINTASQSLFNSNTQAISTSGLFQPTDAAKTTAAAPAEAKPKASSGGDDILMYVVIAAAVGGFIYLKKKRSGGGGV